MTSESGGQWLVEPPGPGEVHFQIAAGDQVEVTPEIQEAFTRLIQALRGDDVQGFVEEPGCTKRSFNCTSNGSCIKEFQHPAPLCFVEYSCKIAGT